MARERNLLTVLAAFFLLLAVSFLGNGDGNAEVVKLESDVNITLGFSPNGGITENTVKAISEEAIGMSFWLRRTASPASQSTTCLLRRNRGESM